MTHEKRLAILERVPVGYTPDLRLFDQRPTSHDAEWQLRLDAWRASPGTVVLICPACNALRGLHKLTCELR